MKTLKDHVKEIVGSNVEGYDREEVKNFISDIVRFGCQSGIISDLVYYSDTVAFFEEHKEEINDLLGELMGDFGVKSIGEILRDFDEDDPLCIEDHNRNYLAWFAFEQTVYNNEEEFIEAFSPEDNDVDEEDGDD